MKEEMMSKLGKPNCRSMIKESQKNGVLMVSLKDVCPSFEIVHMADVRVFNVLNPVTELRVAMRAAGCDMCPPSYQVITPCFMLLCYYVIILLCYGITTHTHTHTYIHTHTHKHKHTQTHIHTHTHTHTHTVTNPRGVHILFTLIYDDVYTLMIHYIIHAIHVIHVIQLDEEDLETGLAECLWELALLLSVDGDEVGSIGSTHLHTNTLAH
jgi:hypothetical protein